MMLEALKSIKMSNQIEKKIYYTLRIATAMCFIGHGTFGIITKEVWCNYFAVFGIGRHVAYHLMPVIGTMDILLGFVFLIYPIRIIPAWLVVWGVVTALLRPLSGEPLAEFFERAGNFGTPLILLMMSGNFEENIKGLFKKVTPNFNQLQLNQIINSLKLIAFSILAAHGWLNMIEKKGLILQYTALGVVNASQMAQVIGLLEIVAAIVVLFRPSKAIVLFLLIWKIVCETLYPHYKLFEWIERGGSYGTLLALWFVLHLHNRVKIYINNDLKTQIN